MPRKPMNPISLYAKKTRAEIAEELRRANIDPRPVVNRVKQLVAESLEEGHHRRSHHAEKESLILFLIPQLLSACSSFLGRAVIPQFQAA